MSRRAVLGARWAGLVVLVLGLAQLHARLLAAEPYDLVGAPQLPWTVALLLVLGALSYGIGLPELPTSRAAVVASALGSIGVSLVVVSLVQLALGQQLLPRSVLGLLVIVTPLFELFCWNVTSDVRQRGQGRVGVLVVAAEHDEVGALAADLADRPDRSARLAATLTPDEILTRSDTDVLVDRAIEASVSIVVLDVAAQSHPRIVQQAATLHQQGIRIRTLSLFYEEWLGKLPVSELERVSLLFDIGELHRRHYVRARRLVDIVFALAGSVVLAMLVPLLLVANLVGNRGPLLFRQQRVGKGGQPFVMLKFRSMTGTDTSTWTRPGDERITPVGQVLRASHLDELPQVVNVLRGELSIVGPRPEQTTYVEELRTKIPFYDVRHLVRPGLTGWAQVRYGYAGHESDALEKLQYDMYYLRRQGVLLDLRIIGQTLRAIATGQGR